MKKLIALSLSLLLALPALLAQEVVVKSDTTESDTVKITTKKKRIYIIKREDEEVDVEEADTVDFSSLSNQRKDHFEGFDFGVSGLLSENMSVDLPSDANFMDLNYAKSIMVGINFMEFYIPIAKEKFGITTGAGFEFFNYDLSRNVTVFADDDTTFGVFNSTDVRDIEKNKFRGTMLNVPLMLETNIGKDADHSFHLQAGVMGSMRVGSKTKQIYEENGKESKVKNRTDFNMNPFRFNAVARIGYGSFTVFATYSLTPLFDTDEGPELYPFTIGVSLASF